ncbi:MAPEG family protein [Tahibacter amnicola]|uniref:MAPEG family protein n=1 Tax=Tahibacter amnicola TaxID=2976241 RepID=A0ABY6BBH7_9GAMM|nr:MAPEG family protein [Tahibacter amnicola]UXI66892.1 MAPEG family protein [Tahibacter amnicola]
MTPIQALLYFVAWTLLLVIVVFLYRGTRFLAGTPITNWPRGERETGDAPIIRRVSDAHANCVENLPLFAAIVLGAAAMGRLDAIQALAPFVVYARVGQSLVHVSGISGPQVFVRAGFWLAQVGLFVAMLFRVLA